MKFGDRVRVKPNCPNSGATGEVYQVETRLGRTYVTVKYDVPFEQRIMGINRLFDSMPYHESELEPVTEVIEAESIHAIVLERDRYKAALEAVVKRLSDRVVSGPTLEALEIAVNAIDKPIIRL